MRKNNILTPKAACLAIHKNVIEWTDRTALQNIHRYMSSVKKNLFKIITLKILNELSRSKKSKFSHFQSAGKQICWIRSGDRA